MFEVIEGESGSISLDGEIQRVSKIYENNKYILYQMPQEDKRCVGETLPNIDDMIADLYISDSEKYASEQHDIVWKALASGLHGLCEELSIRCIDSDALHDSLVDTYGDPNILISDYRHFSDSEDADGWVEMLAYHSNCRHYLNLLHNMHALIEENKKEGDFLVARELKKIFERDLAGSA